MIEAKTTGMKQPCTWHRLQYSANMPGEMIVS